MSDHTSQSVSVSRTIDAPAETLFAILAHTGNHPRIDGSGMVREALPDARISRVGDSFLMAMHNDEMGAYEMRNRVVEYQEGARIVWEPVLAAATREEDKAEIGDEAHHRWGFVLTPEGPNRTVVTEIFDCASSPAWLQDAVKGGERWVDAMTATLEKLDALAAGAAGAFATGAASGAGAA
jgi:uncharacterized protein YndB with AHSA1/START domain